MKKLLYLLIGIIVFIGFSGCDGDSGICMVTFDTDGGSYVASEYVSAGEKVKEPDPDPVKDGYWFNGWYKDCEFSEMWDFDNDVVNKDMTLYARWSSGCVVAGTMVAMADGTSKKVEDINYGDMVKSYDFYAGDVVSRKVIYIEESVFDARNVIEIRTDQGQCLKIVDEQSFFDVEAGQYFIMNAKNYDRMTGRKIIVQDGDCIKTALITSVDMNRQENVSCYELLAEYDINFFADGILTQSPLDVYALPFEIGSDLKVDKAKMEADIEKYGLYTYDDFRDVVSSDGFDKFRMKYLKVLVGKKLVTSGYIRFIIGDVAAEDFKY